MRIYSNCTWALPFPKNFTSGIPSTTTGLSNLCRTACAAPLQTHCACIKSRQYPRLWPQLLSWILNRLQSRPSVAGSANLNQAFSRDRAIDGLHDLTIEIRPLSRAISHLTLRRCRPVPSFETCSRPARLGSVVILAISTLCNQGILVDVSFIRSRRSSR